MAVCPGCNHTVTLFRDHCTCKKRRASGDRLADQMSPLHDGNRRTRREEIRAHRDACKAQGWRPR